MVRNFILKNYEDISDHLIESGLDYFVGGAVKWDKRVANEGAEKKFFMMIEGEN